MHIAILTFDGFNELDSLIALGVLNRVRQPGWIASIASPAARVRSMNGVVIESHIGLEEAAAADAVLIGSGSHTREVVADTTLMAQLQLDPSRQLLGAQCSGALVLAKLGLLRGVAACTDLTTKPWVQEAGVEVLNQPFFAAGNIATAGGCLSAPYLAAWTIARLEGLPAAADALHYVAPVGEKDDYVARALANVAPYLCRASKRLTATAGPATPFWDQHTCPPLQRDATIDSLIRYRRRGGANVSVNAGYSPHGFADTVGLLHDFTAAIKAHPDMDCAATIADVDSITADDRIAVVFDLEDAAPLDGDLDNLATLAGLGVRTLLPTYNHTNLAGGGCFDTDDIGLTSWGRSLVTEMNAVGIVPDGSHCSARTGLGMCELSSGPVIYSHSCMRAVWEHPRNITDDQARASAATGGVVGITGVGIFLGPNTPTLDALTRHLEYAVDLIGIDHVGLSSDFSFDYADFLDELTRSPHLFDESYTRWGPIQWMPPETLLAVGEHLGNRGWTDADIQAVTWRNFYRVAERSWPPNGL